MTTRITITAQKDLTPDITAGTEPRDGLVTQPSGFTVTITGDGYEYKVYDAQIVPSPDDPDHLELVSGREISRAVAA